MTRALSIYNTGIEPHFISNIDSDFTTKILEKLNPETTVFIIVSKTFTTIETLKNEKSIDFVFTNEGVYALRNILKLETFECKNLKKKV